MDVRSGVFDDFVVFGLCARTRDRVKIYCESSAFPASNTQKITAQRPTSSSGRSCMSCVYTTYNTTTVLQYTHNLQTTIMTT